MKRFKKLLRFIFLALFLILAVTGISIVGAAPILAKNEERYNDNDVLIEMVDEKKDDGEKA